MKKFWQGRKKPLIFLFLVFLSWHDFIFVAETLGNYLLPLRPYFLGPSIWANFDGGLYLSIAKNGYFQYQQAFFPIFPLLIRFITSFLDGNYLLGAVLLVFVSSFLAVLLFWKLTRIDFNSSIAKWAVIFLLAFPTSFFMGSVYTESLFLALVLGSFYAARKQRWAIAGLLGGLASGTRLVGIFLLPALVWEWWEQNQNLEFRIKNVELIRKLLPLLLVPIGLLGYMIYLWKSYGDPLLFVHVQPAFGAQRTGGELVFLPQVFWRYLKIFLSVPWSEYVFWIALFEFLTFNFTILLILLAFKNKIRTSYLIFSLLAVATPTLTGTLSSIPRYVLVAFPIFIVLAQLKNPASKMLIFVLSCLLLGIATALFTRGFFVA